PECRPRKGDVGSTHVRLKVKREGTLNLAGTSLSPGRDPRVPHWRSSPPDRDNYTMVRCLSGKRKPQIPRGLWKLAERSRLPYPLSSRELMSCQCSRRPQ